MMHWVNENGIILLIGCYFYALIVSAMPDLPPGAGWWKTFAFHAAQILAANADKVVKESPVMQRFTSKQQTPNGASISEELVTTSAPVPLKPPV